MSLRFGFASSIGEVPATAWDALADTQPFLRHAFLQALESSGCLGPETGWTPLYPTLWRGDVLVAAMPLYLKQHSWGEYVFDRAWAQAYERAGMRYYPKLLSAVPFTPVGGQRLLGLHDDDRRALLAAVLAFVRDTGLSGLHCLFPSAGDAAMLQAAGLIRRDGVQFHWHNAGYRDMEDFLASLTHDKRKKIRQERRKVAQAGITVRRKVGAEIDAVDWIFFERCYRQTYREHRASPYLNLDFFQRLGAALPEACVLVLAEHSGQPVAAALNLADLPGAHPQQTASRRLYGRYWGALVHVPCLHFELCYYQGIEHAIQQGFAVFEGGAQGEHKLARGLMPVATTSWHCLSDARFADAIERHVHQEGEQVAAYRDALEMHAPFRTTPAAGRGGEPV